MECKCKNRFCITKAAVIGAGTMGAGIAALLADAGIPVVLLDIVPPELSDEDKARGIDAASREFRDRFARAGLDRVCDPKRGTIYDPENAALIKIGNIEDDLQLLSDCDWVVEAIIEDLQAKKALFAKIQPFIKHDAFVCTNTSGVPIASICADLPDDIRERFLGTHFFNPPRYMHLLELIPSPDTDPERMAYMEDFGARVLGKGVVVAKDTPNFIGNRIGVHKSVQNIKLMLDYGFDVETVDYLTGPAVGRPRSASFGTTDLVGLDVSCHVAGNIRSALEEAGRKDEAELFRQPDFIDEMRRNGQLGNKSGGGFYKRVQGEKGPGKLAWDYVNKEYVPLKGIKIDIVEQALACKSTRDKLMTLVYDDSEAGRFVWENTKRSILYSAACVPEITDDYTKIDKAMRWGYNWELGPFETWDVIGVERSIEKMKADGDSIPAWVEARIAAGITSFYDSDPLNKSYAGVYKQLENWGESALLDTGDGVLLLEIRTKGNAINDNFKAQVIKALKFCESNPKWAGLILANPGNNFLTGADLKNFLRNADSGNYDAIFGSQREFHKTSMRLKYSKKPVVAAISGKALGGGLEFAMHCSRIVAHADANVGLVETGVGIIPGGGGVKEFLIRTTNRLKDFAITDYNPISRKVWQTIMTGQVSKSAFDARKIGFLLPTDRIVMNRDLLVEEARKEVLRMAEDGYRQAVPKKTKVAGVSGYAMLLSVINSMRNGGMMSDYDVKVGKQLARAVTAADVPKGTELDEWELLEYESEGIENLAVTKETRERIAYILETGRPLKN